MADSSVVGRWNLVTWSLRTAGGLRYPLGPDARGTLIYTADGNMSVMMAAAERPALGNPLPAETPLEEIARAYTSFIAYGGTYEVQDDKVLHHVEFGSVPLHAGTNFVRPFRIEGDELHLTHRTPGGDEGSLTWKRANKKLT